MIKKSYILFFSCIISFSLLAEEPFGIDSDLAYTEMNSKVGNLAKPVPQTWSNEVAPKELNLNKLGNAGGSKIADVRRSQKPTFEFISVYKQKSASTLSKDPLRKLAKVLIHFHQEIISPIDGVRSHFRPSSSQYTLDAILKYGFFEGIAMGCDRLLRENSEEWIYPTVPSDGENFKFDSVDP